MCVYQNVNAPNHALLEVRNHEDGTFELVALNTTYGSSQAGNATVTVKVVALERDVDVWVTELWHKLPIATEVLTHQCSQPPSTRVTAPFCTRVK
jgi:hypothetical protein